MGAPPFLIGRQVISLLVDFLDFKLTQLLFNLSH